MGSRANVAVLYNGEWTHHGSNGMGYSLDAWLALGPDPALAVIASFPVWPKDGRWQTESVCEAGALIDLDAKDLLFFLNRDYDQRIADLDAYRRTWQGWSVRWAYNGISDVTGALGLDPSVVRREPWESTELFRWGRPDPARNPTMAYLVTVGDVAYGLPDAAVQPWQIGPSLLDQLGTLPRLSTWWEVPRGGLHLDPRSRTAGVWSVEPVLGLSARVADRWPGWTVEFWEDRYTEQGRRCGGTFTFPDPARTVNLCRYALLSRVVQHWIYATAEMRSMWDDIGRDSYGMRAAGLTVADLQRLGEVILGSRAPLTVPQDIDPSWAVPPEWSRPLDVEAHARTLLDQWAGNRSAGG